MQSREFEKIFEGPFTDAKWMNLGEEKTEDLQQYLMDKKALKTPLNKEIVRGKIEEKQVEIPAEIRAEMNSFIEQQRRFGVKERAIKRKVQRKFGIVVV